MVKTEPSVLCPQCSSKSIATILWGMPVYSKKIERDLKEGRIVLGGCCITGAEPAWHCNDCGYEFGANPETEEIWNAIFTPEE